MKINDVVTEGWQDGFKQIFNAFSSDMEGGQGWSGSLESANNNAATEAVARNLVTQWANMVTNMWNAEQEQIQKQTRLDKTINVNPVRGANVPVNKLNQGRRTPGNQGFSSSQIAFRNRLVEQLLGFIGGLGVKFKPRPGNPIQRATGMQIDTSPVSKTVEKAVLDIIQNSFKPDMTPNANAIKSGDTIRAFKTVVVGAIADKQREMYGVPSAGPQQANQKTSDAKGVSDEEASKTTASVDFGGPLGDLNEILTADAPDEIKYMPIPVQWVEIKWPVNRGYVDRYIHLNNQWFEDNTDEKGSLIEIDLADPIDPSFANSLQFMVDNTLGKKTHPSSLPSMLAQNLSEQDVTTEDMFAIKRYGDHLGDFVILQGPEWQQFKDQRAGVQ